MGAREVKQYHEVSAEALASLLEVEVARHALSAACAHEGKGPMVSAVAQAKRLAVYAASEQVEQASARLFRAWGRLTLAEQQVIA